jgi:hypothetical protein
MSELPEELERALGFVEGLLVQELGYNDLELRAAITAALAKARAEERDRIGRHE